ncbi:MAG: ABC transporter ATP-binding protein [Egibacteraceae bacterium]
MRPFLPYLGEQRRQFALAFLMLLIEAGTAVGEAVPLAYLIDYLQGARPDLPTMLGLPVIASPRVDTIAIATFGLVAIAVANSAADSLAEICFARGGRRLGFGLRVGLYAHLQSLSLAYHNQRRTGDVITRLTGDVTALEDFVTDSASDLVGSVLVLIGTLVFLTVRSWQVALLAVVLVPLLALISNYFSIRIKSASKRQRAREGDLASAAHEMLTSIRVIQAYGRSGHEERRFAGQSSASLNAALEAAGLEARFSFVVKLLEASSIAAVIWLGVWLIDRNTLSVGTLVLFTALIGQMFKPTRKLIKEWTTIGRLVASAERIAEVLERRPTVVDAPDAIPAPRFRGEIKFRGVSFAYRPDPTDETPNGAEPPLCLDRIDFTIRPGQVLALVGRSGAGKSTIAQLLPRLYDPQAGQVLIDGYNVRRLQIASVRQQISMVLQETMLFSGTVAENIAYGLPDATRSDVVTAAGQANAHEFIVKLPDGYDTLLGERADTLSGGQRQRIAIARALVRNTPILILDEPTTGLDAESTDLVLDALRTLIRGKSTLIISHDLSLVRHADTILVLQEGRITASGTHTELLKHPGLYADLHTRQFGPAGISPSSPSLVDRLAHGLSRRWPQSL